MLIINSAWHTTWTRKRSAQSKLPRDFSRPAETGLKGSRLLTLLLLQTLLRFWQSGKVREEEKSSSKGTKATGPLMALLPSGTKKGFITPSSDPKEGWMLLLPWKAHWKRNCPKYQQDVKDGKVKPNHAGIYTIISNNSPHSKSWVLDTGCGIHIVVTCRD